jgi:UDP-glucose 4-epimerase
MSKICITGGAGFLGSWIANALVEQGHDVLSIDNLSGGFRRNLNDKATLEVIDLCQKEAVEWAFKKFEPEIIYHCAANAREGASFFDPAKIVMANQVATINTLEAAIKCGSLKKWIGMSCHDEKTRVLTKKGLKYYWEIQPDDTVFTLDKNCNLVEQKINKIIINDYYGEMFRYNGKGTSFMVTPNHRICYIKSWAKYPRLDYEKADKFIKRNYTMKPTAKYISGNEDIGVTLPFNINLEDMAYLVGLFIADGVARILDGKRYNQSGLSRVDYLKLRSKQGRFIKVDNRGNQEYSYSPTYRIVFCVPENDKARPRLESILKKYNIKFGNQLHNTCRYVVISNSKELYEILHECGDNAHNKQIPNRWLSLKSKYLLPLWEGLMAGDGNKELTIYTTVSNRLVENCLELATKLGKYITFRYNKINRPCVLKDGRTINGCGAYRIVFSSKEKTRGYNKKNFTKIFYNGKIWCLNVGNSNFLVERDGKITFSGNSMASYGEQTPPFTEDMDLKPCDVYGVAKASMEETVKILAKCYGFDYTIVRPHNIFGERQSIRDKYRNYIGICMNHIMRGEPVYIYGDGQQKRQFSYIEDSMSCYLKLLDSCNGETINIGGTLAYTIEHVAFMVIEAMMEDLTYPIVYLPERYGEVKFAYCDPAKSVKLLGYEDKIGVEEGIVRMSKWAKTLGAREWVNEPLALDSEYIPKTWRK